MKFKIFGELGGKKRSLNFLTNKKSNLQCEVISIVLHFTSFRCLKDYQNVIAYLFGASELCLLESDASNLEFLSERS